MSDLKSSTNYKPREWRAALTLLFPSVAMLIHFLPYGQDIQRMVQLTLLGCTVLYLYWRPSLQCWPVRCAAGVSLLMLFVFGVASSLFSYSPRHAFLEVATLLLLLAAGFAIGKELSYMFQRRLTWLLAIIATGCAAYFLQAFVGYSLFLGLGTVPRVDDLIQNFANYRSFNYAQTITLPMLVLLSCLLKSQYLKTLVFLVAACWWALVFATGARGVAIGVGAGVVLVLLLRRRQGLRFCAVMLGAALVGYLINKLAFVIIPLALGMEPFDLLSEVGRRTLDNPSSNRSILWQRCMEMIAADPLLGMGPMHFAHYGRDLHIAGSPHSWLFQFGAEWGLPALVCVIVAIAAAAVRLVRCAAAVDPSDTQNQTIAAGLIATGTAILVDGLVSGLLVVHVSQLLIAIYIGCASGWVASRSPSTSLITVFPQRLVVSGALLVASVAIILGISKDMRPTPRTPAPDAPAEMYYPRFWFDGGF